MHHKPQNITKIIEKLSTTSRLSGDLKSWNSEVWHGTQLALMLINKTKRLNESGWENGHKDTVWLWLRGRAVVLQPEGRQFHPQYSPSACWSVLGQDAEPRIAHIEQGSAANRCTVWMYNCTENCFEWSSRLEKRYINTDFSGLNWPEILVVWVQVKYSCTDWASAFWRKRFRKRKKKFR